MRRVLGSLLVARRRWPLPLVLALAAVSAILSARCGSSQCTRQSDCGHNESCVFKHPGCKTTGQCLDVGGECGGAFLDDACGCDGKIVHGRCGGGYEGPIPGVGETQTCNGPVDAGSGQDFDATFTSDGGSPFDSGATSGDATAQTGDGAACPAGDASVGRDTCPQTRCPTGWVCTEEIGGVAGGGGTHCVPIAAECNGSATCSCMGTCACGFIFNRPEKCFDHDGGRLISCDNGIR